MKKQKASQGIFYVVRFPTGWELISKRSEVLGEDNHSDWWEGTVAKMVTKRWATHIGEAQEVIESQLSQLVYAFPRGRVSEVDGRFVVFQGSDITSEMKLTRIAVEEAFSIVGTCLWQFDEHEQCQFEDKEMLRLALKITEDWKSV